MLFGKERGRRVGGKKFFRWGSCIFHPSPDKTCFPEMKRKQAWKHLLRKKDKIDPHFLLSPNFHFSKLSSSIFRLKPFHNLMVIISTSLLFFFFFPHYLSIGNNLNFIFFVFVFSFSFSFFSSPAKIRYDPSLFSFFLFLFSLSSFSSFVINLFFASSFFFFFCLCVNLLPGCWEEKLPS